MSSTLLQNHDENSDDEILPGNVVAEIDQLRFRFCTVDDLPVLDEVALSVEFHVGLHNWLLFYKCSPESFLVITNQKNQIVGFVTENGALKEEGFVYRHQIMLLPEYRRQGLMRRYFATKRTRPKHLTIGFNGNNISVQKVFVDRPLIFDYKQIGFEGYISDSVFPLSLGSFIDAEHSEVVDLRPELLSELLEYDSALYSGFNSPKKRTRFTKEYVCSKEFSKTKIALVNGKLMGYGVLRVIDSCYYRISPVYADTPAAGYAILCALANQIPPNGVIFYLGFPASNGASLKFAHDARLNFEYAEVRCYENSRPSLPTAKVFAENEFWPL